ncbi:MAG TPA: hypothetical protein VFR62_04785 [Gemmatimonadales bacterium]|nr:hypothetical protein [Gemmatimonadales bacterium]
MPIRRSLCLCLALTFLLLPAVASAAEPPGAATPQELVKRMTAAAEKGDIAEIANCLAPEDRAELTMGMVAGVGMMVAFMGMGGDMAAGMAEGMTEGMTGEEMTAEQKAQMEKGKKEAAAKAEELQKKYEGILTTHKLDKIMEEGPAGEGPEATAAMVEKLEGVDQGALLAELMAMLEGLGEEKKEAAKGPVDIPTNVRDYKIEGDRATAQSDDETLEFVRVKGRWYFKPPKKEEPEVG